MSVDLLYHAFGLKGYCVQAIRHEDNEIILDTRQPRKSFRGSSCGSSRVFSQGQVLRRFRAVPIGTQPVMIGLAVPRVRCRDCGLVRQVKIPFARRKNPSRAIFFPTSATFSDRCLQSSQQNANKSQAEPEKPIRVG